MGEVFLAEDSRLNRKVALKVLPETFAADKDRLRRFEQEARAASALNHPNILTVYEFGFETDIHFLATELIEGETLREIMSSGELSLSETLNIAEQTAFALSAAHTAGIVHRDLKPENIMIRHDGIVKVLDFGLAKLTEKIEVESDSEAATRALIQTKAGVVMGTVGYMSPEQAKGKDTDERTDIWSLGVVLYEMISSQLPFTGETANERIASILKSEPMPISHHTSSVPKELERIIGKSLRKNREERYQHIKDLWLDLKDIKQDLEFQNKLERNVAPNREESKTQILNATTSDAAHTTLSAKYKDEIKNRKLVFGILSVLILVSIGFGYWFFVSRPVTAKPIESIAVLPFVNESGNADTEYLSDGMTETLISSLSQLPKLSIKARSSVFRYKGKETDAQTIGKELNVQAILNGNVVQRGEQLILNIELVDAQTENVLWSANYNRKQTDLVSLQNEIARDISNKLKTKLSGADEQRLTKNYTESAEAYQLYLKGRFYANKGTPQDLRRAIEFYQQAIAVDPNYALGFAGLADGYSSLSSYEGAFPHEAQPKAKLAALKALSLDDNLAEAHVALCGIFSIYDYEFSEAERECQHAIELNPQYARSYHLYGLLLTRLGRHDESFAQFQRGLEIEPLSLHINKNYGESLFYARRYEESVAQFKKTLELDVNFAPAHDALGFAYHILGRYAESVELFAKYEELRNQPQNAVLMRESFARDGWQGFMRMMSGEHRPANTSSYLVAIYSVGLGEKNRAIAALNDAYEKRNYRIVYIKVDPRLDPLRDDPRFQDLLRRVGFTP